MLLLNVIVSHRILLLGPPDHVGRSIPSVAFFVVNRSICFPTKICTSPNGLFCCRGVCRGELPQQGVPFFHLQVLVAWNSPDTKATNLQQQKQLLGILPTKCSFFSSSSSKSEHSLGKSLGGGCPRGAGRGQKIIAYRRELRSQVLILHSIFLS